MINSRTLLIGNDKLTESLEARQKELARAGLKSEIVGFKTKGGHIFALIGVA